MILTKSLNILISPARDDITEEEIYFAQAIEFSDRSIHSVISFGLFTGEMK